MEEKVNVEFKAEEVKKAETKGVVETKPLEENILPVKLRKAEVQRLKAEGKSLDEIADLFEPIWHGERQLLKAKISLYMSGKKCGGGSGKKKEEMSAIPDVEEVAQKIDEMIESLPDNINHPAHYTIGKIEVIDYLQDKMPPELFEGFCVGNALKYISRYRYKGGLEDMKKAQWYLNRIISVKETV